MAVARGGFTCRHTSIKASLLQLFFQDIAVDGWALTMLSKANRGRGPLCNSIGQNIGYFMSYVGFLALNDAETSDKVWRPLFGIKNRETGGKICYI